MSQIRHLIITKAAAVQFSADICNNILRHEPGRAIVYKSSGFRGGWYNDGSVAVPLVV